MTDFQRRPIRLGPIDGVFFDNHRDYAEAANSKEREAMEGFQEYLTENRDLLLYVARQGDGEGGRLIQMLKGSLFGPPQPELVGYRKKKIPDRLRTTVFERDMYRCVRCGEHKELCADHIHPEVLGGEATFENLQTLCRPCNTSKGSKVVEVPV